MRFFILFWAVLTTFFIFLSPLKAADALDKPQQSVICSPIEPIEPNAAAPRATIWQKTKQQLRLLSKKKGEVEPINPSLYSLMSVVTILETIPYGLGSILVLLGGLFGGATVLSLLFALAGLVGMVGTAIFIIYISKLIGAAKGNENNFLKGKRFLLGYIVFGLLFSFWVAMIWGSISAINGIGSSSGNARPLRGQEAIPGIIVGLIMAAPILIFNIIDQRRYKKYQKEEKAKLDAAQ